MKTAIIFLFAAAACTAAMATPWENSPVQWYRVASGRIPAWRLAPSYIPVLRHTEIRDQLGQYTLNYLTGDRTQVQEHGSLHPNHKQDGLVLYKSGVVDYDAPDGQHIHYTWTADDLGFHVQGAHLPVAPKPQW